MALTETASEPTQQEPTDLRSQALARLRKKDDFKVHLLAYVLVNAVIVAVWVATGSGFFWPVFPMVFWGMGVVFHAWDVYGNAPFGEAAIAREVERLSHDRERSTR